MILEYLKLARISIASLTGLAPVMGAIAAGQVNLLNLFLIFLIGTFCHAFGMTQNDLVDYELDKKSKEISDRPLISGTISIHNAKLFAIGCIISAFVLAELLSFITKEFYSVFILIVPLLFVTTYNIYGKKFAFADVFLAIGMFFFVLYGALSSQVSFSSLSFLVWVICFLGALEMLAINVIQGGYKDAESDSRQGVKTGVLALGVKITKNKVQISDYFMVLAYLMQGLIIFVAYLPFLVNPYFAPSDVFRYSLLFLITIIAFSTFYITHKYLAISQFDRGKIRMLFNFQSYIDFILAPLVLASVTTFALIIILIPAINFYISTLLFHEKFMQPESM
jgi:4-hydroxybenzoate polyprenyltransferase